MEETYVKRREAQSGVSSGAHQCKTSSELSTGTTRFHEYVCAAVPHHEKILGPFKMSRESLNCQKLKLLAVCVGLLANTTSEDLRGLFAELFHDCIILGTNFHQLLIALGLCSCPFCCSLRVTSLERQALCCHRVGDSSQDGI